MRTLAVLFFVKAFSLEDKYLAAVGSFEHRGRY